MQRAETYIVEQVISVLPCPGLKSRKRNASKIKQGDRGVSRAHAKISTTNREVKSYVEQTTTPTRTFAN